MFGLIGLIGIFAVLFSAVMGFAIYEYNKAIGENYNHVRNKNIFVRIFVHFVLFMIFINTAMVLGAYKLILSLMFISTSTILLMAYKCNRASVETYKNIFGDNRIFYDMCANSSITRDYAEYPLASIPMPCSSKNLLTAENYFRTQYLNLPLYTYDAQIKAADNVEGR